jgi:hypothetical protein
MALSQTTLVQRCRYELGDRPWEDASCSAANATSTITGATATFWEKGDIGEFITDGDTFLTISLAATTITATRSYWGSTGAAHTSERVLKNPRYTFTEITNAISAVIQGELLFPRIYKKTADTITPAATTTTWYDLAADALALIDVRQLYGTNDTKEGRFGERHDRRVNLRRNMTTSLVTSGVGLRFPDGFFHASNTVNVDYAARITDAVSGGNYSDLTDGDSLVEAVIYGAVAHLEGALENRKPRKPRQDRETLRGAAYFRSKFDEAVNRASSQLRADSPLLPELSHG